MKKRSTEISEEEEQEIANKRFKEGDHVYSIFAVKRFYSREIDIMNQELQKKYKNKGLKIYVYGRGKEVGIRKKLNELIIKKYGDIIGETRKCLPKRPKLTNQNRCSNMNCNIDINSNVNQSSSVPFNPKFNF